VADVQSWVTNAQENFGWILKAQNEAAALTARRFSSRETASGAILRVEYSVAASQLLITEIERVEANVIIRWTGGQGSVTVERVREHGAEWEVVGASANGEFSDALQESAAYYRLRN
jgi:hypothetical protein